MCVQTPTTTSQLSWPSLVRLASSAGAVLGNASLRASRSGSSEEELVAGDPNLLRSAIADQDRHSAPRDRDRLAGPDRAQVDLSHLGPRRSLVRIHLIDERPKRQRAADANKRLRGLNDEIPACRLCRFAHHRHDAYRPKQTPVEAYGAKVRRRTLRDVTAQASASFAAPAPDLRSSSPRTLPRA